MNIRGVLIGGFVGTTVMTSIMRGAQAFGKTRVDVPLMLGLMVTPDRDKAKLYGSAGHFANGWVFAFLYGAVFQYFKKANWWFGMILGALHSALVLVIGLPMLPGVHPRMATDARGPEPTVELEPPGFMAINYGRQTAIYTVIAHLIFGAILGACYRIGLRDK